MNTIEKNKELIYYIIYNPNKDSYIHGLLNIGNELRTGPDNSILSYTDKQEFLNKYNYITGEDVSDIYTVNEN